MTHAFARLPGYPWPLCRLCYALAPNAGECVPRLARTLGTPTEEEREREARYLEQERRGICESVLYLAASAG